MFFQGRMRVRGGSYRLRVFEYQLKPSLSDRTGPGLDRIGSDRIGSDLLVINLIVRKNKNLRTLPPCIFDGQARLDIRCWMVPAEKLWDVVLSPVKVFGKDL